VSHIRITKEGVSLEDLRGMGFWKHCDLLACRIVVTAEDRLLEVATKKGHTCFLGIDSSVSLDKLAGVLTERGVSVSVEERPGSE
jgi:hypothetical protein